MLGIKQKQNPEAAAQDFENALRDLIKKALAQSNGNVSKAARLLGLTNKGHLGVGADADITIYTRDANRSQMFATPRYVLKGGTLVVEEGQLRRAPQGQRHHVTPGYDTAVERDIKRYFDRYLSLSFENYGA